jgi:hypothetical protein
VHCAGHRNNGADTRGRGGLLLVVDLGAAGLAKLISAACCCGPQAPGGRVGACPQQRRQPMTALLRWGVGSRGRSPRFAQPQAGPLPRCFLLSGSGPL